MRRRNPAGFVTIDELVEAVRERLFAPPREPARLAACLAAVKGSRTGAEALERLYARDLVPASWGDGSRFGAGFERGRIAPKRDPRARQVDWATAKPRPVEIATIATDYEGIEQASRLAREADQRFARFGPMPDITDEGIAFAPRDVLLFGREEFRYVSFMPGTSEETGTARLLGREFFGAKKLGQDWIDFGLDATKALGKWTGVRTAVAGTILWDRAIGADVLNPFEANVAMLLGGYACSELRLPERNERGEYRVKRWILVGM